MSSRKKPRLKPLSLDVTFLSRKGNRKEQISLAVKPDNSVTSCVPKDKRDLPSTSSTKCFDVEEPQQTGLSYYEKRRISEHLNWSAIRKGLVECYIQECCLPTESVCVVCKETAVAKCSFCGPRQYFCHTCALAEHDSRNYFHVMDLWKVSLFNSYNFLSNYHLYIYVWNTKVGSSSQTLVWERLNTTT